MSDIQEAMMAIAKRSKSIVYEIANRSTEEKNRALIAMAEAIESNKASILDANRKDVEFAVSLEKPAAFIDRLTLSDKRIAAMTAAIREIVALPDPVWSGRNTVRRPNGLKILNIRVPLGVVAVIFESRPNVASDISALTIKSGNAAILRGGKESVHSNKAICDAMRGALKSVGFPEDAILLIERTEHEGIIELLKLREMIDVVIPRGGEALVRTVADNSSIPVIFHDKGVCHLFVDAGADRSKAESITVNAKVQKPSVCNAIETLIVHKDYIYTKELIQVLIDQKVEIRADERLMKMMPGLKAATEEDWGTEYLDLIVSVKIADDVQQAVEHINRYGSHHSDAIVSENYTSVQYFLDRVDSAAVYANASTRFTDGGEFGLGAEVGISTQKLHVRGPMGLEGLTTEKWVVYGDGQVRD